MTQIDSIQKKFRDYALEYSQATKQQQDEFRAAWEANGIQFEIVENGMVDFSRQIAQEKLAVEAETSQKLKDLYYERVKFQDDLEQARKDGDIKKYQELLNTESAMQERDLAGRQEYIDEYYAVWK